MSEEIDEDRVILAVHNLKYQDDPPPLPRGYWYGFMNVRNCDYIIQHRPGTMRCYQEWVVSRIDSDNPYHKFVVVGSYDSLSEAMSQHRVEKTEPKFSAGDKVVLTYSRLAGVYEVVEPLNERLMVVVHSPSTGSIELEFREEELQLAGDGEE